MEDMEKRALLAVALSLLVLMLWWWLFPPPAPAPPVLPPEQLPPEQPAAPSQAVEAAPEVPAPPGEAVGDAEERTQTVETEHYRVTFTNRGARVLSWEIAEHRNGDGTPLQLVRPEAIGADFLPLGIDLDDVALASKINAALFVMERTSSPGAGGDELRFRWSDGRGLEAEKTLRFERSGELVEIACAVRDRGRRLPVRLVWGPGFDARPPGSGEKGYYYYSDQAVWLAGGTLTREKKIEEELVPRGAVRWAGLEDQYFAVLFVPRGSSAGVRVWPVARPGGPEAEPRQVPALAVGVPDEGAYLYAGPKHYRRLKALGFELQRVVWFSSIWLFDVMARALYYVLVWLHDRTVPNYGVAIILATVLLRIALFPFNQFSMVRMRRMQVQMQRLQPKIDAIKARYRKKKDAESRMQMNKELMDLYKKEGVNPMGGVSGCLPLLIQFPILIGFYDMLLAAVELKGAPFFGWIRDLTQADPYLVTPILMGVTMFVQQKMSMSKAGDPAQQRIMMLTPVIFTVMFLYLPSGLVLYWFVNNLLGIAQQWLVNRTTAKLEQAAQRA